MDAAIAALLGTAVGAAGSIGGIWLQQRHQSRRDPAKLAAHLGLADFTWRRERAAEQGGRMLPLSIYIAYHLDVLDALEDGEFNPTRIAQIGDRQASLLKAVAALGKPKDPADGA